jgi:hypothetical protein
MKKLLAGLLILILPLLLVTQDDTQEKLKKLVGEIEKLKSEYEKKITDLEKQIKELKEKIEEKELQQESLSRDFEREKKESQKFRQQISRVSYLPDISVIGDLRFRGGNNITDEKFFLNEVEMAISGAVDPYFYYDSFFALERESSGEMHFDVEEAYVKYLGIKEIGIRAGRFFIPVTKSNTWHTHQRLFGEVPLYYNEYFNEERFKTEGIHIYYQISKPATEISFYLLTNKNAEIFNPDSSHLLPLLSIKNLFPFSADADIESITSFSYGNNQFGSNTFLAANTLFFRWKNPNYSNNKIQILTENIFARVGGLEDKEKYANYSLFYYNFTKYLGAGLDFGLAKSIAGSNYNTAYGIIFDIIPSEFSFLRFNYQHKVSTNDNIFLIELNFIVGKHRAHSH